ncbi:MAG: hypothetical protein CYG60_06460 [Actinobacteria bacterium]|nr:MAG: hypothetical protein CYG60_06460 [Actinomycetota bacterium]
MLGGLFDALGDPLQRPRLVLGRLHLVLEVFVVEVAAPFEEERVDRPLGLVRLALQVFVVRRDGDARLQVPVFEGL